MSTDVTTTRHRTAADLADALGGFDLLQILVEPAPGTATESDRLRVAAERFARVELVEETLVVKGVVPTVDEGGPRTLQHVVDRLGGIPLDRIRLDPPLGTATEEDAVRINESGMDGLVEVVDGILVDKPMGTFEAHAAAVLNWFLQSYLDEQPIGYAIGPDGMVRFSAQRREPDLSFFRWERTPNGVVEREPASSIIPNLAVEVLSPSNTVAEIERKRREYFSDGVELMWVIEPELWTVDVWTDADTSTHLTIDGTLDGGDVLPGFELPIRRLAERTTGPGRRAGE